MSNIRFEFDHEKSLQAINYLHQKLREKRDKLKLDRWALNKLMFYADRYHINKYGRFICGDFYVAMDDGLVPSCIYHLVRNNNPDIVESKDRWIGTNRTFDLDKLSRSDREALDFVVNKYSHLTSAELKEETHKEEEWINNHIPGSSKEVPIEQIIKSDPVREYVQYWLKEHDQFDNWLTDL